MQAASFDEIVERILARDTRYHREAYVFVREALDYTHATVGKSAKGAKGTVRHVTGQELLVGVRAWALEQYGPMARTVLEAWGVRRGEDVGEIVFNLVDAGLLGKTEKDSRDDFRGGYDFVEAFDRPFLPVSKQGESEVAAKPSQA